MFITEETAENKLGNIILSGLKFLPLYPIGYVPYGSIYVINIGRTLWREQFN